MTIGFYAFYPIVWANTDLLMARYFENAAHEIPPSLYFFLLVFRYIDYGVFIVRYRYGILAIDK
ncbi:Putative protein [Zobellia galactanivorans]|uniref:Uncharacterized protein n=1 Tax=Zobellia galactanivorans (strain DSM 12802 / CCUG 47099 / CIP 106680 / NCIMB 13871 / Dsij) TaxID=63186 RepID=G0L2C3_ZOBGA|nr:Putative protein [Zobellia galactanivorans]